MAELGTFKKIIDRENLRKVRIFFVASVVCCFIFYYLMPRMDKNHQDFIVGRLFIVFVSLLGFLVSFRKPTPFKAIRWILNTGIHAYLLTYLYLLIVNDWSVSYRWAYFVVITIMATTTLYWEDYVALFVVGLLGPIICGVFSPLNALALLHFHTTAMATLFVVGLSVQANFRYRKKLGDLTDDLLKNSMRIQTDLKAARDIQRSLLPAFDHDFGRASMQILYQPCEDLSGDFFEVRKITDQEILFYIADVTSHGTPAAQVTYLLKGIFENVIARLDGPIVLTDIAQKMAADYIAYDLEYSVCLGIGCFNQETGRLDYLSSGLHDAQLIRDQKFETLPSLQNPMVDKMTLPTDLNFRMNTHDLMPGDSLYFFTDGAVEFTDRMNLKTRTDRDLGRILVKTDGDEWRKSVMSEFADIHGGLNFEDDITILRLHYRAAGSLRAAAPDKVAG